MIFLLFLKLIKKHVNKNLEHLNAHNLVNTIKSGLEVIKLSSFSDSK